jgi:hypothetical protein
MIALTMAMMMAMSTDIRLAQAPIRICGVVRLDGDAATIEPALSSQRFVLDDPVMRDEAEEMVRGGLIDGSSYCIGVSMKVDGRRHVAYVDQYQEAGGLPRRR